MIYLLTPTGGRPEGLALLAEYLDAQTYKGRCKWLIVDDVDPATPVPKTRFETQVIRPDWRWNGHNTQAQSLLAGLEFIPDDATVLICEDDDYYAPEHVVNIVKALETCELVGERVARYYNVRTGRFRVMSGGRNAALASTGVRGEALKRLRAVCESSKTMIDVKLWQFNGPKRLLDTNHVIGIKGLPGRKGIGVGHRKTFGDIDQAGVLADWLGAERTAAYDQFRRV